MRIFPWLLEGGLGGVAAGWRDGGGEGVWRQDEEEGVSVNCQSCHASGNMFLRNASYSAATAAARFVGWDQNYIKISYIYNQK